MSLNDTPFNTKIKLECECAACESKYKIIYFEDEITSEIKVCPFCGEPAEEYAEQNETTETNGIGDDNLKEDILYTNDDGDIFDEDIIDDDDYPTKD